MNKYQHRIYNKMYLVDNSAKISSVFFWNPCCINDMLYTGYGTYTHDLYWYLSTSSTRHWFIMHLPSHSGSLPLWMHGLLLQRILQIWNLRIAYCSRTNLILSHTWNNLILFYFYFFKHVYRVNMNLHRCGVWYSFIILNKEAFNDLSITRLLNFSLTITTYSR